VGVVGVLVCGAALGTVSGVAQGSAGGGARANAARKVVPVDESMSTSVSKIEGNTIIAHGQALQGRFKGYISFYLKLVNGSQAYATFTVTGKEGTIRGSSSGNYHVSGALSYFSGRIGSLQATGALAQDKSLGLVTSGTLDRRTYKMYATVKGKLSVID
jgi:hypothetical protein